MKTEIIKRAIKYVVNEIELKLNSLKYYIAKNEDISKEEALSILEKERANPRKTCYLNQPIINCKDKDCTIIIPVYNCEKYVSRCIESVLNASVKYNIEIVVINDGSTDDTYKMLNKYRNRSNIRIINQINKGQSCARNVGIDMSKGKYLMFVDSDDELYMNSIDKMLDTAYKYNADLVQGSFNYISVDGSVVEEEIYANERVSPMGNLHGYPWAKLYKYDIFKNLRFPEGLWFEDSINAHIIWYLARKSYTISDVVYAYMYNNPTSMTNTLRRNPKSIDSLYITGSLLDDKKYFNIELDNETKLYFLRMVKLTYRRTHTLGLKIARSIFCVQCYLYERFNGIALSDMKYKNIDAALTNHNFRKYIKEVNKNTF